MIWSAITLTELHSLIESELSDEGTPEYRLWSMTKIPPEKWIEQEYGNEGGGFWAVALMGNHVVWYNDIEDGFNVSPFSIYGQINGYQAEQIELRHLLSDITRHLQEGTIGRYSW